MTQLLALCNVTSLFLFIQFSWKSRTHWLFESLFISFILQPASLQILLTPNIKYDIFVATSNWYSSLNLTFLTLLVILLICYPFWKFYPPFHSVVWLSLTLLFLPFFSLSAIISFFFLYLAFNYNFTQSLWMILSLIHDHGTK